MNTKLNPYLNFKSNARQAMEFYQVCLRRQASMNTFKEYHASQTPDEDDLIMHAELNAGDGLLFFASDTPNGMEFHPRNEHEHVVDR